MKNILLPLLIRTSRVLFLFLGLCCLFFLIHGGESTPCREAVSGRHHVSKEFLPFEQAMEKARAFGISSVIEYIKWQKEHPDMPSTPDRTYAKHWKGWGRFLGTGRVRGRPPKLFLPFEQAMEKVRAFGISSQKAYREWQKEHPDMPSRPYKVYRKHWKGWRHFLGTEKVWKKEFLPFKQAMEKARAFGISSVIEYMKWRKKHPDMPSAPQDIYAEYWQSWRHFLGIKRVWKGPPRKLFLSFEQAMEKARAFGISSVIEYIKWQKEHPDMPSTPDRTYAKHWKGWGRFLGTGRVRGRPPKLFLPFEQAMEKVRAFGISSQKAYREWQKEHPDMPSNPDRIYAKHWKGWGYFLGTEQSPTKSGKEAQET